MISISNNDSDNDIDTDANNNNAATDNDYSICVCPYHGRRPHKRDTKHRKIEINNNTTSTTNNKHNNKHTTKIDMPRQAAGPSPVEGHLLTIKASACY